MAPSASRGPRSSRAWRLSGAAPGILLLENRFGDDDSLDLRGPLADLRKFHVAVDAFYRVVFDEAVPAVDLHRLRRRAGRRLGGVEFGHGGFPPERASLVGQHRGAGPEPPGGRDLG